MSLSATVSCRRSLLNRAWNLLLGCNGLIHSHPVSTPSPNIHQHYSPITDPSTIRCKDHEIECRSADKFQRKTAKEPPTRDRLGSIWPPLKGRSSILSYDRSTCNRMTGSIVFAIFRTLISSHVDWPAIGCEFIIRFKHICWNQRCVELDWSMHGCRLYDILKTWPWDLIGRSMRGCRMVDTLSWDLIGRSMRGCHMADTLSWDLIGRSMRGFCIPWHTILELDCMVVSCVDAVYTWHTFNFHFNIYWLVDPCVEPWMPHEWHNFFELYWSIHAGMLYAWHFIVSWLVDPFVDAVCLTYFLASWFIWSMSGCWMPDILHCVLIGRSIRGCCLPDILSRVLISRSMCGCLGYRTIIGYQPLTIACMISIWHHPYLVPYLKYEI